MNNREAFEAWARENKPTFSLSISSSKPDQYNYVSTNYLWLGYQAGLASQAQQEPLKVSENWREPLSADAMLRLKNLGVLDKSPAPEGDKE